MIIYSSTDPNHPAYNNDTAPEATNWEQIGYYLVIAVTGVATVFAGAIGAAVFVYFQFMGGV